MKKMITSKLNIKGVISTGLVSFGDHPIWFDLEKGEENIHKLQQELGKKLTLKGSYLEKRPFHAHLTIGKIKKKGRSKLPKVEIILNNPL